MVIILGCNCVFAVSFKDQADIDKIEWAKDAIMDMAEKGIISGMTDGTFKPGDSIKKLDCLMLIAKALGSIKPENKEEVDAAVEQYKSYLNNYLIYGKAEISYLLKKGVLKTHELPDYIGASSAHSTMLRYEAAILLVKAMGKEQEALDGTAATPPFSDQNLIPERARSFVDLLYKEDIMKGTSATEFSPFLPVTRAQMAVLLYKASAKFVPDAQQTATVQGTITKVEEDLNIVGIKNKADSSETSYSVSSATITVDGDTGTIGDLFEGMKAAVKIADGKVVKLEAQTPDITRIETGTISAIQTSGAAKKVKVRIDRNGSTEIKEYTIGANAIVIKNGIETTNASIKLNDYAAVQLANDGSVYKLTLEGKEKEVTGKIKEITTDLPASITIERDEEEFTYNILSTVTVRRNNRAATIWDIRNGDTVTLILHYDEVKEISASGKRTQLEGVLEEMLISRKPYITIRDANGDIEKFDVVTDTKITISGEIETFYDLRVGCNVLLKLESDMVVEIIAEQPKQAQQITGTIDQINDKIGVVSVKPDTDSSSVEQLYFPRETTVKIINALTGKSLNTSELKKGQKIVAFGYNELGIFVTTQITVIGE